MPKLIKFIDQISREKNRDVLYISFDFKLFDDDGMPNLSNPDYESNEIRLNLLEWLKKNHIPYEECGSIADENSMISYSGQIYIDVPMDENNPKYKLLCNHLEDKSGNCKIDGIGFFYLPLTKAMENAHHDKPGFWEKWAEKF